MTDKLQVKEHLRNGALYQPLKDSSLREDWKSRLFRQYSMQKHLKLLLAERAGFFRRPLNFVPSIAFVLLAFAVYFGFLQPGQWLETLASITDYEFPPIGLKETLVFIGIMNGWTFFVLKKRISL